MRPAPFRRLARCDGRPSRASKLTACGLLVTTMVLAACATGPPTPPAYTQEELAERCVRTGGWWHGVSPGSLFSGFCEYPSPRFP